MEKIIIFLFLFFATFLQIKTHGQQLPFKPVIIELNSTTAGYTVPNDSILKVETIGVEYFGDCSDFIKINGIHMAIRESWGNNGFSQELKYPFWLPSSTLIEFGNDGYLWCQQQRGTVKILIFALLFPE